MVWGVLIWDEWPDQLALVGIALILAGGLYTLYRENIKSVDVITSSPMPATAALAQPPERLDDEVLLQLILSQKFNFWPILHEYGVLALAY